MYLSYLSSNCRCPTDQLYWALQPSIQLAPRFVVSVWVKTMSGYFWHLPPALCNSDRFVRRISTPFGEERHFDSWLWNGTEIPGKPSKTRYAKTLLINSFQFHTQIVKCHESLFRPKQFLSSLHGRKGRHGPTYPSQSQDTAKRPIKYGLAFNAKRVGGTFTAPCAKTIGLAAEDSNSVSSIPSQLFGLSWFLTWLSCNM